MRGSRMRLPLILAAVAIPAVALAAQPVGPAPKWPPGPTKDVIQGVTVADPYRALENAADPAVQQWSDAQNDRTRAYLDNIPGRAAVAAKLKGLVTAASPAYSDLQPR